MFGSQALTCTHARVNTCIWELGMYMYYTCIGWYILSLCIQQSFQHNSHYNYMVYPLAHALKWFVTLLLEPRPFVTLFSILLVSFQQPMTVQRWVTLFTINTLMAHFGSSYNIFINSSPNVFTGFVLFCHFFSSILSSSIYHLLPTNTTILLVY